MNNINFPTLKMRGAWLFRHPPPLMTKKNKNETRTNI